jgi:hypothetical protein
MVGEGEVLDLAKIRQMTRGRGRHEPDDLGSSTGAENGNAGWNVLYRRDWLPDLGDEIEIVEPGGHTVQATVTGLEKTKALPIRASER